METPYVLLLSLPTDGFQQCFPTAGCRSHPHPHAGATPQRDGDWGARGAAAYSRPFTVLTKQQRLNLVLHLIPSREEVSVFPSRGLTAHARTDSSELTPTPYCVTSHPQPCGKRGLLVPLLRYHQENHQRSSEKPPRRSAERPPCKQGSSNSKCRQGFRSVGYFCVACARPSKHGHEENKPTVANAQNFNILPNFSPQSQHPEHNHLAKMPASKRHVSF